MLTVAGRPPKEQPLFRYNPLQRTARTETLTQTTPSMVLLFRFTARTQTRRSSTTPLTSS